LTVATPARGDKKTMIDRRNMKSQFEKEPEYYTFKTEPKGQLLQTKSKKKQPRGNRLHPSTRLCTRPLVTYLLETTSIGINNFTF
jgi:hypothetical protein